MDLPDGLEELITVKVKATTLEGTAAAYVYQDFVDVALAVFAHCEREVRGLKLEIEELRKETSGDDLHERPEWQAHPKALPGLPLSWRPKGERGAELLKAEEGKG